MWGMSVRLRYTDVMSAPWRIETAGGTGPYEAKAIGELANNATAAAIANAAADAVGTRVFELPITAERVRAAGEG